MIGLILVGVYSLVQYRVLGTLTIASLVIAAVATYLALALLSWVQGYRLSLAGVAGIIVAIGITADSFIVYLNVSAMSSVKGAASMEPLRWGGTVRNEPSLPLML